MHENRMAERSVMRFFLVNTFDANAFFKYKDLGFTHEYNINTIKVILIPIMYIYHD